MKSRIDTPRQSIPNPSTPTTNNTPQQSVQAIQTNRTLGWVTLPLRLFLGITFIYAGLQKLMDPQYFNPTAARYIGKQITAIATGSPLHAFLINFAAPHAMVVGALVAYGELFIGIGVLLGWFLRPATFFGMALNILFFLSATWHVYPYFYGSDIVFVFCWLALFVAGPVNSVMPTLDALIVSQLRHNGHAQFASTLGFILGVSPHTPIIPGSAQTRSAFPSVYVSQAVVRPAHTGRRNFIWGMVTGGVGMLGLAWLSSIAHLIPQPDNAGSPAVEEIPPTGIANTPVAPSTTVTAATPGDSTVIAQVSQVPVNSAATFTLASNGDPGVLVHLPNGRFVAFDAACTHAGCPVSYDPASKLLLCPCHGAAFDPAHAGAVVQGPAQTPLIAVPVHVDNTSGAITVSNS